MQKKLQTFLFLTTSALAIGSLTAISEKYISSYIDAFLPSTSKVDIFSRPGTIELISSEGLIIQKLGPATRQKIAPEKMPEIVVKAFVAAEDRRFYKHKGVDLWSILRATITNIKERSVVEGGSTITQQLARIIFLNQDKTLQRKLKEIGLAYKLERNLSKKQIVGQYLNNVYLGSNAYGISDASWIYFQKAPGQLSIAEAALIAGLAPAPSLYSPLVNIDLALKRRSIVLQKMRLENFISDSELSIAINSPVALEPATPKFSQSKAPFFTSHVEQELPHILSKEQLEIGGLKVITSVNFSWQLKAQEIIKQYSPPEAEGAIVSIEPKTGLIRVLVGGIDFNKNQFNRATQALRSPGSTFKIFPYIAAIQTGFKPEDVLFDTPRCWYGYCPKNFGNKYYGEVSLTHAFANSLNTIAVDLLSQVGFEKVITIANSLGIGKNTNLGKFYPLAIGAYEETILNMTAAYAGVANRGIYIKPSAIEEIRGPDDEIIWTHKSQKEKTTQVISPEVADTMNWMLRQVVLKGSGRAASLKNRQVAGKTGTSEGNRDLWFIGSIPQLTTSVWYGRDNNKEVKGSSGDSAYSWKQFMISIANDIENKNFPKSSYPKSF